MYCKSARSLTKTLVAESICSKAAPKRVIVTVYVVTLHSFQATQGRAETPKFLFLKSSAISRADQTYIFSCSLSFNAV